MAAQAQALLFNSRYDLKQFAKGVCTGADPHKASLRKYFICTNIYDEAFTEYPCNGWQKLVDCFCVVVDKCDGLQVFVIHSAAFTSMEEVEVIASTIKELAGQVLGHHPNLTRLVQYGPANATTDVWYVKWALMDKENSRLGAGHLTTTAVLSEHKDLSQGGRRLQMTREQKRARDWMMSEMGGSYEDDPDSSDEDAANTDEDEVDNEGNADKEETDANGDGADSDNNEYDDSETEPEADDEDEDDELREDANHLDQQTDMMDEDAPRIKRQRVE